MTSSHVLRSTRLGDIELDPCSEIYLPLGLPGFESERRMVPVEIPSQRPLIYLHSTASPDLCFVTLPTLIVDPNFRLDLSEDDSAALELPPFSSPVIGEDILCLALLIPSGGSVQTNLAAPVVINLHNFRCVQAVGSCRPAHFRLAAGGRWEALC